jgi:hypothetical protein
VVFRGDDSDSSGEEAGGQDDEEDGCGVGGGRGLGGGGGGGGGDSGVRLAVEDPQTPGRDAANGSYRADQVLATFRRAAAALRRAAVSGAIGAGKGKVLAGATAESDEAPLSALLGRSMGTEFSTDSHRAAGGTGAGMIVVMCC